MVARLTRIVIPAPPGLNAAAAARGGSDRKYAPFMPPPSGGSAPSPAGQPSRGGSGNLSRPGDVAVPKGFSDSDEEEAAPAAKPKQEEVHVCSLGVGVKQRCWHAHGLSHRLAHGLVHTRSTSCGLCLLDPCGLGAAGCDMVLGSWVYACSFYQPVCCWWFCSSSTLGGPGQQAGTVALHPPRGMATDVEAAPSWYAAAQWLCQ